MWICLLSCPLVFCLWHPWKWPLDQILGLRGRGHHCKVILQWNLCWWFISQMSCLWECIGTRKQGKREERERERSPMSTAKMRRHFYEHLGCCVNNWVSFSLDSPRSNLFLFPLWWRVQAKLSGLFIAWKSLYGHCFIALTLISTFNGAMMMTRARWGPLLRPADSWFTLHVLSGFSSWRSQVLRFTIGSAQMVPFLWKSNSIGKYHIWPLPNQKTAFHFAVLYTVNFSSVF